MSKGREDTGHQLCPLQVLPGAQSAQGLRGLASPVPPRCLGKAGGRSSPEPGQCYFLGQSKSQRMKADD